MKKNSICVFCGASNGDDEVFAKDGLELGRKIFENGFKLIYGGGKAGIMGAVANGVLENNGSIHGIIPSYLNEREGVYLKIKELEVVDTMAQRKTKMIDASDSFCMLAGGFGSLDEFFEVLVLKQLDVIKAPIIIVNKNGFWNDLIKLCENIFDRKFAHDAKRHIYTVVDNVEDVIPTIKKELAEQ